MEGKKKEIHSLAKECTQWRFGGAYLKCSVFVEFDNSEDDSVEFFDDSTDHMSHNSGYKVSRDYTVNLGMYLQKGIECS